jgi:hypothetical protein
MFPPLDKITEEVMANEKTGSKQNAITDGIFAGIVLSGPGSAEADEFEKLLSDAKDAIRPRNDLKGVIRRP